MAEWSNAAVLKTVEGKTSGGSNPSLSAKAENKALRKKGFLCRNADENVVFSKHDETKTPHRGFV